MTTKPNSKDSVLYGTNAINAELKRQLTATSSLVILGDLQFMLNRLKYPWEAFLTILKTRGTHTRIITTSARHARLFSGIAGFQAKYAPEFAHMPQVAFFFKDTAFYVMPQNEPYAICIKLKELAQSERATFDMIWEKLQ